MNGGRNHYARPIFQTCKTFPLKTAFEMLLNILTPITDNDGIYAVSKMFEFSDALYIFVPTRPDSTQGHDLCSDPHTYVLFIPEIARIPHFEAL